MIGNDIEMKMVVVSVTIDFDLNVTGGICACLIYIMWRLVTHTGGYVIYMTHDFYVLELVGKKTCDHDSYRKA